MKIRNRIENVMDLQTHILQSYLSLKLNDGWQDKLFVIAHDTIQANRKYGYMYKNAYETMRDYGINNYDVNNMDITLIACIIKYCPNIVSVSADIKASVEILKNLRNVDGHSNYNESDVDLYRRSNAILSELKNLVHIIGNTEKNIESQSLLSFQQQYIEKIDRLIDLLDQERIEFVESVKTIKQSIESIKSALDVDKAWLYEYKKYSDYFFKEGKYEIYHNFVINASDEGIKQAHIYAAQSCFFQGRINDCLDRLSLAVKTCSANDYGTMKHVVDSINDCLKHSNYRKGSAEYIINNMKDAGYSVAISSDGYYLISK